jgi:predicted glycogen debranching enzyme
MTSITAETLQDWEDASRREWLVTNGIGGYASASVVGANTRRYHGLLVAAFEPPLGRTVVLSKLEEEVRIEDQLYLLSSNKYPSVVQPQGYRHLTSFTNRPVPTFTFVFHEDTVVLEKRIWMAHGENTVYVQYHLVKAPEKIRLGLLPLMAYKDYHSEQHRWDGFRGDTSTEQGGRVKFVATESAHPMYMGADQPFMFSAHSGWFYNFEHQREQERGLDFTEDLFCPGRFDGVLLPGQKVTFIATVESTLPAKPDDALKAEIERQEKLLAAAGVDINHDSARGELILAADQFVVEKTPRVERATVIAGYHWFTDWGRDTMIALPGLCLTTCRHEIAREILASFAGVTKNGLLPNRFSDNNGGAEYNTVDASLWYFHAVHEYAEASGDWKFAECEMLPVLTDIVDHHIQGTEYGIHVDPADGLLVAGQPGVQLTWMDARVGDWVVTPRIGKPVEINALWYNALRVLAVLNHRSGNDKKATELDKRAAKVKASFLNEFWNPGTHSLFDVIAPDGRPDPMIRPNQIFAISLPFALLEGDKAKQVLEVVESLLVTPYGLRTLAPGAPEYRGHYGPGDQIARDGAYHQGTVWPWLIGPFIDAHLKVHNDKARARALLDTLVGKSLDTYGVGTIGEIFDGDPPFAANGCIAQAWSVSEVLRALAKTS